jgi:hypothetical protein
LFHGSALLRSSARLTWRESVRCRLPPSLFALSSGVRTLDAATVVVVQGLGADNRGVVEGTALLAQIR